MSDPRYIPRSWAQAPAQFGRRLELEWREAQGVDEASELAAARRQHELTYLIRRRLDEQAQPIRWLAEQMGASYDRTTKLLRGLVVMRIQDVTDAERVLGPLCTPNTRSQA